MKPEKRINLQIVSVENGYVVSEFDPVNHMMEGRRWVAESRLALNHLVEDLCRGEAAESPGGAIAFTARRSDTPPLVTRGRLINAAEVSD